jgi:hypothetical protein
MMFSPGDNGCPEVDTRIDAQAASLAAKAGSSQSALNGLANFIVGGANESPSDYNTASSYGGGGYSGASRRTAGTEVHVRGHTRANGVYVSAHTRAAPGRGRR